MRLLAGLRILVHLEINQTSNNNVVLVFVGRKVVKSCPQAPKDQGIGCLLGWERSFEWTKLDSLVHHRLALDITPDGKHQRIGLFEEKDLFSLGHVALTSGLVAVL